MMSISLSSSQREVVFQKDN